MADLGSIGISLPLAYSRLLPVWAEDYRGILNIPVNGVLSGTVKQAGTPVAGRWVRLYYRPNGFLIGSVRSGPSGEFSFSGLDPGAQYFVIAFDDLNQAPDFNAVIFDQLTPV
jgi:hypothetical protein